MKDAPISLEYRQVLGTKLSILYVVQGLDQDINVKSSKAIAAYSL